MKISERVNIGRLLSEGRSGLRIPESKTLENLLDQLNVRLPSPLEGQLKDMEIGEALKEAHFPTVARETQREARLRLEQFTAEEITPLDALKKDLESKQTPPKEQRCFWNTGGC